MRDVVVFAIVFGALPFAFLRPFWGLVLFTWLAYMRAPDLTWGAARTFRFSLVVGFVMFLGWFLFDNRPFMRKDRRNVFMILLAACVGISYLVSAEFKAPHLEAKLVEFFKVIAVAVFTTGQLDSKSRIRTLLLVMTLSFAFYGVKGGLWGLIVPDARIIRGPGGLLLDNNDFSLAMVMNIPFLWYLSFTESHPRMKQFLRAAVVLTVITIVLTGSRGGFLAMATVFFVIVLKSRYKRYAVPGALVAALLFLAFIPESYKERIASIRTAAKTDASAIGRLRAWRVAIEMIRHNPFFGVGYQNFAYRYADYDPHDEPTVVRVAHNSYFQIWAESGTIAFAFFLATLFSTIRLLRRLQRLQEARAGPSWIGHYAAAIEVSLYGFLVGATFLNRGHFDFFYQEVGVAVSLNLVARAALAAEARRGRGRSGPVTVTVRSRDPYVLPGGAG